MRLTLIESTGRQAYGLAHGSIGHPTAGEAGRRMADSRNVDRLLSGAIVVRLPATQCIERGCSDGMRKEDYISLNVPRLLAHYSNPPPEWRATILAAARTQIEVLRAHSMIRSDAPALSEPVEDAVIRFADYTPLGQSFVLSGELERWLRGCDRAARLAAYEDRVRLEKRVLKFLAGRQVDPR